MVRSGRPPPDAFCRPPATCANEEASMTPKPAGAESVTSSDTPATLPPSRYAGPKDVGRAESLYRSAVSKPDLDYAAQLLFSALAANPEHAEAFRAVLAKIPSFAAARRKMVVRISDLVGNSPADGFLKHLAAYCAAPGPDAALACAAEAQRAGLGAHAVLLGGRVLEQVESGEDVPKAASVARLIELFEACGAMEHAARAARAATRLFPDDQDFRQREKNVLASKYLRENDLTSAAGYRATLKDAQKQDALHRPSDHLARLDELEQRYRQTHGLEDFRELVRALRESA